MSQGLMWDAQRAQAVLVRGRSALPSADDEWRRAPVMNQQAANLPLMLVTLVARDATLLVAA